ncbi:hypothetical protein ACFVW1_13895 [Streptomyces olivochromogenes]|uniref:hypothetical protein n=1 Tax=Streptomyces olivochromogenes TaxID=1963 RepID=UPI0036D8354D
MRTDEEPQISVSRLLLLYRLQSRPQQLRARVTPGPGGMSGIDNATDWTNFVRRNWTDYISSREATAKKSVSHVGETRRHGRR